MKKDSVYELQNMLRKIFSAEKINVMLTPDGIYGDETERAVKIFQKQHGINPTGITDQTTWDAIVKEYKDVMEQCSAGEGIYPFYAGCCCSSGERSDLVYIIQVMLTALGVVYDDFPEIEINGTFDEPTEQAVKIFQRINRLSETGTVDIRTWNALAKSYNSFANNPCYIS